MRLSIVSTLYQSAPHLEEFYARVRTAAAALTDDYEIVLVNDGSPDASLDIALALLQRDARVRVIDLARNFGHHRAMMTGLGMATGDLIFLIDSDLEEDPELLTVFHDRLQQTGADVIYGVQNKRRGPPMQRLGGWAFYTVFNALSNWKIAANLVTVRLMTRQYVGALVAHREREMLIAGLWAITGFRQVSQPIRKHSYSTTMYSLTHKVAILVNSITSFSDKPLVLIFYMGLLIAALAAVAAAYLVVRRVFFGVLLAGWPSLIVSVWLLGGLTLFSLGIIGMYLSKVFLETKQRPYTIIRQVHERPASDPETLRQMRETAARYYSEKIMQFGATARGVDWNSEESQIRRFEELLRLADEYDETSINDYGCGYGALADYLRRRGRLSRYTGFDISESMIDHAVAAHASDPLCTFTADADALQPADYTFASGVFNVKKEHPAEAWQEYVLATLATMDRLSTRGFAFNMLSSYSDADKQRAHLFYGRPTFFFDYCKTHFAPRVTLLHDYPLYEFTILVRK